MVYLLGKNLSPVNFYESFFREKFNGSPLFAFQDRKMYSYQYMDSKNNLIFRYDNAEHHRKLNLPTFPHHKHDRSEDNVIKSNAPFLAEVLKEVKIILR